MPQEIKQIDLLVHPFFDYAGEDEKRYEGNYGRIEAEIMLEIWKASIDEIAKDKSRILVLVSSTLRKKNLERAGDDDLVWKVMKRSKIHISIEWELLKYADEKLDDRLFFCQSSITKKVGNNLQRLNFDAKKVVVNAYGEWTVECVKDQTKILIKCLSIPKRNVRFKPKKSVDVLNGYPRRWEIEKLKRLPKEKRKREIRKRVEIYKKARGRFR